MDMADDQIVALLKTPGSAERGFRLLLHKYQERLYWHIRRLVVDHEDTNDVLQNCLLKIFKNIDSFEGKSQLFTWLYRIATNEALTFMEGRRRKSTESLSDHEGVLANRLQAAGHFNGDEAQRQLQSALQHLPDKQRAVFNLRYFDEMSYEEISSVLDTSVGALKASYHHAVKKIENYFKGVVIT